MKVCILAGGLGTRLSEETANIPKPLVEIGGMPILRQIMSIFSAQGYKHFVVLAGYKSYLIKEYFFNFFKHNSDLRINLATGVVQPIGNQVDTDWVVEVLDTGLETQTGGRLLKAKPLLEDPFLLTYGDGLGNVRLDALVATHLKLKSIATVTSVPAPGRFGNIKSNGDRVTGFSEKSEGITHRINAGFMMVDPRIFDYIEGDYTSLELDTLPALASLNALSHVPHNGFWHPMDTLRDKKFLESLSNTKPWLLELNAK